MAWPGEELFSIGRRMHSTGFCVEWPVSELLFLSICHTEVCVRSPAQKTPDIAAHADPAISIPGTSAKLRAGRIDQPA
jgi:hypothetical protein